MSKCDCTTTIIQTDDGAQCSRCHTPFTGIDDEQYLQHPTRGGKREGAGRPVGSSKPHPRSVRLTQRYTVGEMHLLELTANRAGYTNINEYIRDVALGG